jgi:Rrf2 family protein
MIKLSKKVEYGLMSLLHLATMKNDSLVTCKDIASHYCIPVEILGKVLQGLARAELIESYHGVTGGYRLNKTLPEIRLGEVIEALEGPIHITPCTCEHYVCAQEPHCNIKEPIFHFQDRLLKFMYEISLASFQHPNSDEAQDVTLPAVCRFDQDLSSS